MAKMEEQLCGSATPGGQIGQTKPVEERSDMADLASAAFLDDLASIADTVSCPDKGNK